MSFKRDGDDKSALDNQRKRRVRDLLFEDIQKEEVTRLSNGKLKCKLCSHQPIFDTLDMFYVHKQGKKHLYSLEYNTAQKQELNDLIEKRKHEQLMIASNTIRKQTEDTESGQEINIPSYAIKKPRKPYERKAILDLETNKTTSTLATCRNQLPDKRFKKISKDNKTSQEAALRVCGDDPSQMFNTSRYSRCAEDSGSERHGHISSHRNKSLQHGEINSVVSAMNVHKLVGQSNAIQNNKYYLSRKKQREEIKESVGGRIFDKCSNQSTVSPSQTWEYYKNYKSKTHFNMKPTDVHVEKCSEGDKIHGKHDKTLEKPSQNTSTSKLGKDYNEKYLQALGSGWKKDWTGAWIKDEDVEFDSDDEPPDIT